MKKQNKKIKQPLVKRLFATRRNATLMVVAVAFVGIGGYFVYGYAWGAYYNYRTAIDQASTEPIRSLILNAADNIGRDAPLDPKTGDVYFPEAKLYLPRPEQNVHLTYTANLSDDAAEIGVVDKLALSQRRANILAAQNVDEVFAAVPRLQSCSRGVVLTYANRPPAVHNESEFKHAIPLSNGKTLYAYIEKECQENAATAELLKNLQPY